MTKIELNGFRRVLAKKLTEVGSSNGSREALAIETTSDELDRVQNANDRDYAMSNLERSSRRLGEVRAALRRIDAGTFGVCDGCEENINLKRLAAVPWTPYCIACQEAADRGQDTLQTEIEMPLLAA
jgi:RNA polymerase-binding transcription factor